MQCVEGLAQVPYIGRLLPKVPFYRFIGKLELPEDNEDDEDAGGFKLPDRVGKPAVRGTVDKLDVEVPTFQKPRLERVATGFKSA